MKDLSHKVSRSIWFLMSLTFVPGFFLLFRPSVTQFIVLSIVDYVAFRLLLFWEKKCLVRKRPELFPYFLGEVPQRIERASSEKRAHLVEDLIRFPERFAGYCFKSSFIKIIPAALMTAYFFSDKTPWGSTLLRFYAWVGFHYFFFFGAVYLETLRTISDTLLDLHQSFDLAPALAKVKFKIQGEKSQLYESFALFPLWGSIFLTQVILVITENHIQFLIAQLVYLYLDSVLLTAKIWLLSKNTYAHGLQKVVATLEENVPSSFSTTLPPHPSPLLARYAQSFNALSSRLRMYEQEVAAWVFSYAELSRFGAVGELTSLIIHDLSGPLHVIRFCSEELALNPRKIQDPQYVKYLLEGLEKCTSLVDTLRNAVRLDRNPSGTCSIKKTADLARELLQLQYRSHKISDSFIFLDSSLDNLAVALPESSLFHILFNLLGNSVKNSLEYQSDLKILVREEKGNQEFVILRIADNGSGLSKSEFEKWTSSPLLKEEQPSALGIGLRLTRRLVERHGGSLEVLSEGDQPGTVWLLTMQRAAESSVHSSSRQAYLTERMNHRPELTL